VVDKTHVEARLAAAIPDSRLRSVMRLHAGGYNHAEISQLLADGTTSRAVEGMIYRIRKQSTRGTSMAADEHKREVDDLIAASSLGADGMAELCARTPDNLVAAVTRPPRAEWQSVGPPIPKAIHDAVTSRTSLARDLRTYRDRRLLRDLTVRAQWIAEARNAPAVQDWLERLDR